MISSPPPPPPVLTVLETLFAVRTKTAMYHQSIRVLLALLVCFYLSPFVLSF